ncbi:Pentatricopeptide repeat-containing protein [Acorus calamus]|uniref:Pentatricopeptide repeat-containing protein n=1 Tax=Acorus calamus TaxID=4465 RepID=A0AAV9BZB2_ACOCL|nr:Pentatricopeptide repeat-containing protein [Acorus calamus]
MRGLVITMRDKGKNRRPIQKGRYLTTEAIQAVQALKRAATAETRTTDGGSSSFSSSSTVKRVIDSKVRRLVKLDLVAVLNELLSQNEGLLALQVFEEIRKEYWYKPQFSVYVDMITVLASNGLYEKVKVLCSYLKSEDLEADIEGFNSVLVALMDFGITKTAMECFRLMKLVGCEPDESTFKILINGLELKGESNVSEFVREEAVSRFGPSLDFLNEEEEMVLTDD